MRPFMVIPGIPLAGLFSISFSLLIVLLIFCIFRDVDPRFTAETPELVRAMSIFTVLTAFAALGFIGAARDRL